MLNRVLPTLIIAVMGMGSCLSFALEEETTALEAVVSQAEIDNAILQSIQEVEAINQWNQSTGHLAGRYFRGETSETTSTQQTVGKGLFSKTKAAAKP